MLFTSAKGVILEIKKPTGTEAQRLQKTLFHEKQTLIENRLFGVDINPNSVKICRLRLWIELLKNAYYKDVPSSNFSLPAGETRRNYTLKSVNSELKKLHAEARTQNSE